MTETLTTEAMIRNAAQEMLAMQLFREARIPLEMQGSGTRSWLGVGKEKRDKYRAQAGQIMEGELL